MKTADLERALHAIFNVCASGETGSLAPYMTQQTYWQVPGSSPFAGRFEGPEACLGMIRSRLDVSTPELKPFGKDIAVTEHHGILLFAVTAHRANERLTSHEIIVVDHGAHAIEAVHHYIFNLGEFDDFWTS